DETIAKKLTDKRAVEIVRAVVERHRIPVSAGRQTARGNGIRRGREFLSRTQGYVGTAVCPHADLQPAVGAGKIGAVIQRCGERAVADENGLSDRAAELAGATGAVEQREGQVVRAIGGTSAVRQAALIDKGRALGAGWVGKCKQVAKRKDCHELNR